MGKIRHISISAFIALLCSVAFNDALAHEYAQTNLQESPRTSIKHSLQSSYRSAVGDSPQQAFIQSPQDELIVINGVVKDAMTNTKLENVTVSLEGTSIGTVTNADGAFSLKIPQDTRNGRLEFSHLGYLNNFIAVSGSFNVSVMMMPVSRVIKESIVYGADAREIVTEALKRIPSNYSSTDNLLSAFYRETIRKNSRYMSISEAMIDVLKTDYTHRRITSDRVRIAKARRLLSQKQSDTLSVKVSGGPNLALIMDMAKNPDLLFDNESVRYYQFHQEASVMIDDRIHYVIRFTPSAQVNYALCAGKLFIDSETLAFTRAEFSLDLSSHEKAEKQVLRRKPLGLRFRLLDVDFIVSYKTHNGVNNLNYICNQIRFKCDWRSRLFSSTYTARSEMVVVDNQENPGIEITNKDAFKTTEVFYDVVQEYWNEDFWKDYNILEPTENLENAVRRLKNQK